MTERQRAKKRVLVAEDVLKLLRGRKFEAEAGTYLRTRVPGDKPAVGTDLRDVFKKPKVKCVGCALGSMLLARAIRDDAVPFSLYGYSRYSINQRLTDIFGIDDLQTIEGAFENWGTGSWKWTRLFPDDHDRLRAIMKNIVLNNGDFQVGEAERMKELAG